MYLRKKADSFIQHSHLKHFQLATFSSLVGEFSSETPKILAPHSSSWLAILKALHLDVQVAEAPVLPQKGFYRSHKVSWDLPQGKSSGCVFSAPFPVRTIRLGPSWPSPEHRIRESKATKELMLSIFLGHVKHFGAKLLDTLELCMERSGVVLGCATLSSHHPPFSVLVPYHCFLWKRWSFLFVCVLVCLFFRPGSGLISEKFSRESGYHRWLWGSTWNRLVHKSTRHFQHKSCRGTSL